jgi:aminopeptidase
VIDADAFAVLIAEWCLEVRPGQQILVETTTLAQELASALHSAILERDAWPLLRITPPGIGNPVNRGAEFFRHARERHLDGFAPMSLLEAQTADSRVRIDAPGSAGITAADPGLVTRQEAATAQLQLARAAIRWCGTIWPTPALADRAGMSESAYEQFLERALFLDQPDPVVAWRALSARQATVVDRLTPVSEIRIETARTDLTLTVAGRSWANSDGKRNMPSGEVFTSPHELSANGTIHFDVPSHRGGFQVSDVELRFVDGEVVGAHAADGDEYLQAALVTDTGARFLGEIGIGTNTGIDRATGSTLLDEKIAGTVHLALGRSYPETGGRNESALHWDLICDLRKGGRLTVDGEPLIIDGELV